MTNLAIVVLNNPKGVTVVRKLRTAVARFRRPKGFDILEIHPAEDEQELQYLFKLFTATEETGHTT